MMTEGDSTSSETSDEGGQSIFVPRSPRIPALIGAALGYYSVLDKPGSAEITTLEDEYDQLNFRDVPGESASGSFSSLQLRRPSLHAVRRLHKHAHSQYLKLSQQVSRRYVYLRQPLQWTPKHVKLRDKFSFVLGISHLTVSAYWLGWSPSTFYRLYTAKAVLLFTLRAVLYRRAKMHYYLWDFCYYANALMLLHIWALPEACELQRILFAFSMGPLAWTIILFRNSMIFHSLDKMTSVFLHVFPPLVAWCSRWFPPDSKHWKSSNGRGCAANNASIRDLILIPWLPYALWAVFYYFKIFVISSRRIQERGYHTLFRYMTRKPKSFFGRLARALPGWASALVFMVWHVLFCAVTFMLTWAMWQSFWLNTVFIAAVFYTSVWNGGNYYFEVFARRYLNDVQSAADVQEDSVREVTRRHSVGVAEIDEDGDNFEELNEGERGVVRAASEGALSDSVGLPLELPPMLRGRKDGGSGLTQLANSLRLRVPQAGERVHESD